MNPNPTKSVSSSKRFVLSMSIGLMIAQSCFSATMPARRTLAFSENEGSAKKNKTKSFSTRNNPSVKIYPDAVKKMMHVVAKKNNVRTIDFFVFDLEGILVQHYKMKAGDHMKITGLKKGEYVYRVFSGDEETAAGNFEIR
ncbi:MAG: hypothetical protein ABUL41_01050 [Chitinophagaceae bacterium]